MVKLNILEFRMEVERQQEAEEARREILKIERKLIETARAAEEARREAEEAERELSSWKGFVLELKERNNPTLLVSNLPFTATDEQVNICLHFSSMIIHHKF